VGWVVCILETVYMSSIFLRSNEQFEVTLSDGRVDVSIPFFSLFQWWSLGSRSIWEAVDSKLEGAPALTGAQVEVRAGQRSPALSLESGFLEPAAGQWGGAGQGSFGPGAQGEEEGTPRAEGAVEESWSNIWRCWNWWRAGWMWSSKMKSTAWPVYMGQINITMGRRSLTC
jgi:hypothetical protein